MAERLITNMSETGVEGPAFIDLEASGLSDKSWPIEVGWGFAEGAPRTLLIRPHETWRRSAWDPKAEDLHGVSIAELERDGTEPKEVCRILNAALDGVTVYSDALDWDGFWLYRLYSVGGVKPSFTLRDFSYAMNALPPERIESVIARADAEAPRRHRAGPDVANMQALYRLAQETAPDD